MADGLKLICVFSSKKNKKNYNIFHFTFPPHYLLANAKVFEQHIQDLLHIHTACNLAQ